MFGLSRLPTAGKEGKKSAIEELMDMQRKKAGKGVPTVPQPQYTEAELRAKLRQKKKTDPSVDVERAIAFYKSIGVCK